MSKRFKFFIGHLTISAIIALIAICIVFLFWYPSPLAKALGVTHLFFMLIIIDVIVGPLFGLLVYKEGKKNLKMDLATVIILQICAFSYGFYTIAQGRPAWIVYDSLTFNIIKNSDIEMSNIEQANPEFQHPSWFGPQFVALNALPKQFLINPVPKNTIALDHPMYYTNISNAKLRLQTSAFPVELLEKYNDQQLVGKILKKYPQANAWLGLSAPAIDMVVLINKDQGNVVKIVDLRPWN
ncbi:TfpX/TfpZ family type IV pilin accessory protein [Acinetobacter populi]|uniref:Type IV pilin accessory protein n=1 Tax=Acinetobacter populi TaxID=1582270 RepID=A0A1Z9YWG0_9GAMM|nr:TfpX/TfpZ family type IV pilin accessory protein [Acinetobacter populi]OUY06562.1 type IV pilin accessory protein [Acinetobacter populi]